MIGIPTRPASQWNGDRAEAVRRVSVRVGDLTGELVLLDVNRAGALVQAGRTLRTGTNVRIRFVVDGEDHEFDARVVGVSSRYRPDEAARHRIGLAFRVPTAAQWQTVDRMVDQLCANAAAESCQPAVEVEAAA